MERKLKTREKLILNFQVVLKSCQKCSLKTAILFIKRSPLTTNNNIITPYEGGEISKETNAKAKEKVQKLCNHLHSCVKCTHMSSSSLSNKYMQLAHEGCLEAFSMASAHFTESLFCLFYTLSCLPLNVCIACS